MFDEKSTSVTLCLLEKQTYRNLLEQSRSGRSYGPPTTPYLKIVSIESISKQVRFICFHIDLK